MLKKISGFAQTTEAEKVMVMIAQRANGVHLLEAVAAPQQPALQAPAR